VTRGLQLGSVRPPIPLETAPSVPKYPRVYKCRKLNDSIALNVIRRDHATLSGMVVDQHDRGGRELERALDHFARVDRRVVDGAGLLHR
jgi:hypothetical protein